MPGIPALLSASGFRGDSPKAFVNTIGARAVGGVSGIDGVAKARRLEIVRRLRALNLSDKVVSHSKGFRKLEINQLNTLLEKLVS